MSNCIGYQFINEGFVEFRTFSEEASEIRLHLDGHDYPMEPEAVPGYFRLSQKAVPGSRYGYAINGGPCFPDLMSRFQPQGVHELSELVDLDAITKNRPSWKGIPFGDLIIYELHIGTFTEEGTYLSAIARIDELVSLGITAIEILPLAQAAGRWNWGYDGVNLFAPANAYGRPEDLVTFIDAAHERGIAVILDVVYNHLGPEGNYLFTYEGLLSKKHTTPWGDALNYDGPNAEVARSMVLENARYWIEDYGFDGLRIDATHFIKDSSPFHIVSELGSLVRKLEDKLDRPLHLIGETNVYDPVLLKPVEEGGSGFDGLWCDEFLHSCYAQLRPDEAMTSRNYDANDFPTALQKGYVYEGTLTDHYKRSNPKTSPFRAKHETLVISLQNHDFIGNHPDGTRIHKSCSEDAQWAAAAILFLLPSVPMIFMGEEFSCDSPFYFFVDFQDEPLRRSVERGRKRDHPQHDWSNTASPTSPEAFFRSKIGPSSKGNSETLSWYTALIRCRKNWAKNNLLTTNSLTANWNPDHKAVILQYENAGEMRFLFARLHARGEKANPVAVEIQGHISLSQNYEHNDAHFGLAQPFAVIAGEGTITFQER